MLRERFWRARLRPGRRRFAPGRFPALGLRAALGPSLGLTLALAVVGPGALAGCGVAQPGNGEDLQVTYYYLPG